MVRVGKYKLGARAGRYKLGARTCKYILGVRAGKYKLGGRAAAQAKGQGAGNIKTLHITFFQMLSWGFWISLLISSMLVSLNRNFGIYF